ncbi:hypothetical protein K435DRAFT_810073 [Dendrothele bispora CBS 962.96]|uniref:Uncharacterized protein n=1 Tax=Dendrothele bispora (strain CBS 962.96) TaxID=1314807 RepID=A0A4S8KW47_DENBC|nr:hypothetical protein K435DRAFT_810073 [Dendrothele bispora CBS 962.96]
MSHNWNLAFNTTYMAPSGSRVSLTSESNSYVNPISGENSSASESSMSDVPPATCLSYAPSYFAQLDIDQKHAVDPLLASTISANWQHFTIILVHNILLVLKLRNCVPTSSASLSKKQKVSSIADESESSHYESLDTDNLDSKWLEILSETEKRDIMTEFFDAGSNAAVKGVECSFCGALETVDNILSIACCDLDISLLERAVHVLQLKSNQPAIQPFCKETIENGCYHVCTVCKRDIRSPDIEVAIVGKIATGVSDMTE